MNPVVTSESDNLLNDFQRGERHFFDAVSKFYYKHDDYGNLFIIYAVAGVVLLFIAHLCFYYPEALWLLQTFMSVRGGEPTDFYIISNKVGAVIITAAAYLLFPLLLMLEPRSMLP